MQSTMNTNKSRLKLPLALEITKLISIVIFIMSLGLTIYSAVIKKDGDDTLILIAFTFVLLSVTLIINVISNIYAKWKLENIELIEEVDSLKKEVEELNNKKTKAEEENKKKSEFLNAIAVKIKTPLSTIMGMNEMMEGEGLGKAADECLKNIHQSSKNIEALIGDILLLTEIGEEDFKLDKITFSTNNMLEEAYIRAKNIADRNKIVLTMDVDSNVPKAISGDEERLRQVIFCLLANAIDYTPVGSVNLNVSAENVVSVADNTDGDSKDKVLIKVSVKDTGIGIKEEDLHNIFGRFKENASSQELIVSGESLSLMVANKVLGFMGSFLQVESEYGQGTKVSFSVMCDVEDASLLDLDEENSNKLPKSYEVKNFIAPKATVLAVDDNRMNLAVIKGLLQPTKINVECVSSAEACLDAVREKHYDMIFMDYLMPDMDGLQTLSKMKKLNDNLCKDTPVVVVTANATNSMKEHFLRSGFNEFISKPIERAMLYQVIIKLLPEELVVMVDSLEEQIAMDVLSIKEDILKDFTEEDINKEIKKVMGLMSDFNIDEAVGTLKDLLNEELPEGIGIEVERAYDAMISKDYELAGKLLNDMVKED